jgi:hypothetical protein
VAQPNPNKKHRAEPSNTLNHPHNCDDSPSVDPIPSSTEVSVNAESLKRKARPASPANLISNHSSDCSETSINLAEDIDMTTDQSGGFSGVDAAIYQELISMGFDDGQIRAAFQNGNKASSSAIQWIFDNPGVRVSAPSTAIVPGTAGAVGGEAGATAAKRSRTNNSPKQGPLNQGDADIEKAIALSLQQSSGGDSAIVPGTNSDDVMMTQAIMESLSANSEGVQGFQDPSDPHRRKRDTQNNIPAGLKNTGNICWCNPP